MVILPLSSAKETSSLPALRGYLALHTCLVILRFWGHPENGAPWVICTLVQIRLLLDWSNINAETKSYRHQLAHANLQIESLAEGTTKSLFCRFCDATVALNAEMNISEPAPALAALLGLPENTMLGRPFASLVDSG